MKIVFINGLGGKFEVENIFCIEYLDGHELRLSFEKKHYLNAISILHPSSYCFNDQAMTIDIEVNEYNYHQGNDWNGYIVDGHLYQYFEIHKQ